MKLRSIMDYGTFPPTTLETLTGSGEALVDHSDRHKGEAENVVQPGTDWLSTRIDHPSGVSIVNTWTGQYDESETDAEHFDRHFQTVRDYVAAL